jgi:hypothetical protein
MRFARHREYGRLAAAALLLLCGIDGEALADRLDALAADGLYTWRVASADDVPAWCCGCWNESRQGGACDLDSRHGSFGVLNDVWHGLQAPDEEMQIYALIEAGVARRIRVLSPSCPVTSRRDVVDLGVVEVDESLEWLEDRVVPGESPGGGALAAIAAHRGPAAMQFLVEMADAGPTPGLRKDAIFWMSQARIGESAGELERLMFHDESAAIRRHAAFALSQSEAANRSDALIRQGREDADPEVRSQAWFWLAQTGAAESEEAILEAIADDRDGDVREEAVFALSQLPEERGVDALFALLREPAVPRSIRERALFWLAQSDSDRAYDYLDRLLAGQ